MLQLTSFQLVCLFKLSKQAVFWGAPDKCLYLVQVFVTSQYLAIAMEYAAGGDMFEHVVRKGGLKESEARWFFQQLLVGVDYVHRMVSATT